MDIAVTGSSGLIGSALRDHLTREGHRVVRVVRGERRERASVDEIRWDPENSRIDTGAFEGLDAVVHLAGEGIGERRWTAAQKQRLRSSRIVGTGLVAEALASCRRPPGAFISASAIGYYGNTGDDVVDESSPPGHDFLARLCADWESATAAAPEAGIRTAIIRTGIVLSTRGGALARQLPAFRLGLGGRAGSGRQYQSWITLDDEVSAIAFLLGSTISGPVNLTAPSPVTNAEFAATLGSVLHRPTTILPMIGPRALFGRELADALLLGGQRVEPAVLLRAGFRFGHDDLASALSSMLR
jgi:hypothetical protein